MRSASQERLARLCLVNLLLLFNGLLPQSTSANQPNVIVILTDDQGWGDLSVNGNSNLATPNIDSLARDGVTLENFYVCQVCAPTRAEFLTGRYYPRTGVSGVSRGEGRLNPDETTIADIFQKNGYATGCFGKWHNGTQSPYHPNDRGFDEFYGFTSGHWGHYLSPPLDHNGKRVRGEGFIVDDFTNHAIEFIETNQDEPFFCYLPLNTPHSPMMVPDRFYKKFDGANLARKHREPKREDIMMTRAALALCENIDYNVGRVLKKLEELQLSENTIVVYFSDNGPNSYRWNGGMKGRKGLLDEGGLRSPFFIRWPAQIPGGRKIDKVHGAVDLLPTLTRLAGASAEGLLPKPIDGYNFNGALLGQKEVPETRYLFSIKNKSVSVRTQDFRLASDGKLYNISKDRGQLVDVSALHPKLLEQLQSQAAEHAAEMQRQFQRFASRPFTVGYSTSTTLPARDGVPHGSIQRSSKAPNNSFFKNWMDPDDSITWNIDVGHAGNYSAIVYYTCAAGNEGCILQVGLDDGWSTQNKVIKVFDPPLYDKSKERVAKSHYFVKDFEPLNLGTLRLPKGNGTLRLKGLNRKGNGFVDVHSIELRRLD
ncbi:MAG: arylsulfatase [Planctomycetota bacterium]|nr:arylsulfatase [Planctomycetota bacterium]